MSFIGRSLILLFLGILLASPFAIASDDGAEAIRDISNEQVDVASLREAVASRTLTWLTGSSANNDYISVGRTANFFGFVGLRVASGQSLTRNDVALDALAVLSSEQRDALVALLQDQEEPFQRTHDSRYKMNRALEGLLIGEPISREAFLDLGRAYGSSEAELGRVIGQRLGDVAQTLTPVQVSELEAIRAAHISGQGQQIEKKRLELDLPQEDKQELVNIAARFLSWTTGSQVFNDFEVVGKPSQHFGFVSLRIESNHGVRRGDVAKEVWSILTPSQQLMLGAAAAHDVRQFGDFLEARGQLMRAFEVALSGEAINVGEVQRLGSAVGESEASMTWAQATAMLKVRNSLSNYQSAKLLGMRSKYTAAAETSLPQDPVERGRQLFAQCALCHDSTSRQALGPNLTGIVGRHIADQASYDGYSVALRDYASKEAVWSEALLDSFLQSPKSLVPGTYMGFDGLDAEKDRSALITYLKTR